MIAALLLSSAVHAQTCKDVWNDAQKPWRPNSKLDYAVQVDAAACDRQVGDQHGYPTAGIPAMHGGAPLEVRPLGAAAG
jgi:hypothetical protein